MTPTTTPTINGLRLVTPEEAGKQNKCRHGNDVDAVIERDGISLAYVSGSLVYHGQWLIPLPKPRTTRPFKRGEVKCGNVFRSKDSKRDYMTCAVDDTHISLHQAGSVTYKYLYDNFDRLTYDSEGREVLVVAGQVEE